MIFFRIFQYVFKESKHIDKKTKFDKNEYLTPVVQFMNVPECESVFIF